MKLKTFLFISSMLLFGIQPQAFAAETSSSSMTAEQAFTAGQGMASQANLNALKGTISSGSASENLYGYSGNPLNESTYWQGNKSTISPMISDGAVKIEECAGPGLAYTDPIKRQHCEAVDAIAKQPSKRPPAMIDRNDPLIVQGGKITANPEAIAGSINGIQAECKTITQTNPPSFELETCEDYAAASNETCRFGSDVVVDPDYLYSCIDRISTLQDSSCSLGREINVQKQHNYQCKQNDYAVNNPSCKRTLTVQVEKTTSYSCTPGEWIRIVTYYETTPDYLLIEVKCEPDRNDGNAYFRTYAAGAKGTCSGWLYKTLPLTTSSSLVIFDHLKPNWAGSCQTVSVFYGQGSCSGNSCSKYFYFRGPRGRYDRWGYWTRPYGTQVNTEKEVWENLCSALEAKSK